jgi:hypothetical protein
MTPEIAAQDRPIRTVSATSTPFVVYHNGGDALLRMTNDRGSFEILVTSDRSQSFLDQMRVLDDDTSVDLTGFWRRRSGIRETGERHFIWCLVLVSWLPGEDLSLAA